jgi:alkanesulfonate monooxygenase SsuD/methylene tetrahydromethanopterin reductase-like flavin-dependent oxidoreductase (luciferase family)
MSRWPLLGVSLDGAGAHPAVLQEQGVAQWLLDVDHLVDLARLAESVGFDFVSLDDSFDPDDDALASFRFDALLSLARVAPLTSRIGLMATVTVTHTEPFHVSKNVATLDLISGGRAGWRVAVSTSVAAARRFGRKDAQPRDQLVAEAGDVVEVVRRLWDSWEDDAVIRDRATGRYIDRDRLHYVDFEGEFFNVRGPSITPRPPQGQPVVAVDVDGPLGVEFGGQRADLVLVHATDIDTARTRREEVRGAAQSAGRDPDAVTVVVVAHIGESNQRRVLDRIVARGAVPGPDLVGSAAEVAETIRRWTDSGAADGFLLQPDVLPTTLEWLVSDVVPALDRPLPQEGSASPTFRDRLGLARPANRYTVSGASA